MSTANNMNMAQTSMNASKTSMKRSDGMKRKIVLSSRLPATTVAANPMRNLLSDSNEKSRFDLIDTALGIVDSPLSSSDDNVAKRRGSMLQRRGSLLCQRRTSELLSDNCDRLSELLLLNSQGLVDFSSDDESDLEE
ncbi:unnamed protein product [Cylindrotheca closterium]|uniref:Uncharacterized protein n=1 Tax=Cylindrotheca closterium TaxID=2856 RepID=A0AAD2FGR3_9STRA|nr:unnamed protein product [Cylindrotheca closterium]